MLYDNSKDISCLCSVVNLLLTSLIQKEQWYLGPKSKHGLAEVRHAFLRQQCTLLGVLGTLTEPSGVTNGQHLSMCTKCASTSDFITKFLVVWFNKLGHVRLFLSLYDWSVPCLSAVLSKYYHESKDMSIEFVLSLGIHVIIDFLYSCALNMDFVSVCCVKFLQQHRNRFTK